MIVNLTDRVATPEEVAAGVVDVTTAHLHNLRHLWGPSAELTKPIRESRVMQICGIASLGTSTPYPKYALLPRDQEPAGIYRFVVKDLLRLKITAVVFHNGNFHEITVDANGTHMSTHPITITPNTTPVEAQL